MDQSPCRSISSASEVDDERRMKRLLSALVILGACAFTSTQIFYESRLAASPQLDEAESRLVREGDRSIPVEGQMSRIT